MDKRLIAERFAKAAGTYGREATVQIEIAEHMTELLLSHIHGFRPERVLEFGCGTGSYSRMLMKRLTPAHLTLNDLCREMLEQCADLTEAGAVSLPGDAEHLEFPSGQSLITSCSTLQWFDNPGEFFDKCCRSLNAGGYLAFSSFGKENMKEVTQLTGDALPYPSTDELKSELSRHYDVLCAREEIIEKHFESPKDVLRHLKHTGVTGIRSRHWTPRQLLEFCNQYTARFGSERQVTLTYHPIYFIARKR